MKKYSVCIVGAGVVGQSTGRGFSRRGIDVSFIDVRSDAIQSLKKEGFNASMPAELIGKPCDTDFTIFTVSTPTQSGKIDLSNLFSAVKDFGTRLAATDSYHVVVVRSTVLPGTTDRIGRLLEKQTGKKAGRDFGLCMNPEYLREESAERDFDNPWLIVIGQNDKKSGDTLVGLYQGYSCPIVRVGLKEAETQKYIHNIFNAVKISFFNEFRAVCERIGVNADEIFPLVAKSAEGMWNPAYGIKNLGPFSGMCLPKDTQAFLHWARSMGWDMPLLAQAIAVNNSLAKESVFRTLMDAHAKANGGPLPLPEPLMVNN